MSNFVPFPNGSVGRCLARCGLRSRRRAPSGAPCAPPRDHGAKPAALLYELAWRHSVTLEYIQPWLAEALFELATTTQPCAIGNRQKVEIALALLNNTRLHPFSSDDEPSTIDAQSAALLAIVDAHALYYPDAAAEGAYHRALVARDKLDYPELSRLVDSIAGEDPVWMLRKAAMLTELGRSGEVTELLSVAYGRLLDPM